MSATVTFPNGDWPTGYGFQINFISNDRNSNAILAQSQQFNITSSGGAAGGSTSMMSTSTMSSMTRSMTTPTTMSRSTMSTASGASSSAANAGDASGGIPGAVSYPSRSISFSPLIPRLWYPDCSLVHLILCPQLGIRTCPPSTSIPRCHRRSPPLSSQAWEMMR